MLFLTHTERENDIDIVSYRQTDCGTPLSLELGRLRGKVIRNELKPSFYLIFIKYDKYFSQHFLCNIKEHETYKQKHIQKCTRTLQYALSQQQTNKSENFLIYSSFVLSLKQRF